MADSTAASATSVPGATGTASQVQRVLWLYALLVMAITAGAWMYYNAHDDIYLRPLFNGDFQYTDLTLYADKMAHLRDGAAALASGYPLYTYPAPAAYVYKVLLLGGADFGLKLYLVLLSQFALAYAFATSRAAEATTPGKLGSAIAIVATAFLSFPLWFTADRANIEAIVWAFAAAGLAFLLRGRYRTAAVLIGIAASIKPFPALFFLLLLRRKRYKEAALGGLVTAALTVAALASLGRTPLQAYRDLQPGVALYVQNQVTNIAFGEEARFEHSLLDGAKSVALLVRTRGFHAEAAEEISDRLSSEPGSWPLMATLARWYVPFAAVGIVVLAAVFFRKPLLNQLTAAGVAVTLFPLVAADYTLLHLYVPFAAFLIFLVRDVGTGRAEFPVRSMVALAVIYALLFSPLTFLDIYAGGAKLLLLLALLFVAARSPMRSAYFGDALTAAS